LLGVGTQELLILFLVVLLLFGADRIPEVARGLGKSIRDFKRAAEDIETEIQQVAKEKDLLTGDTKPAPKGIVKNGSPRRREPPPSESYPQGNSSDSGN
jgi:sec-independent protein translocase protein TatA